MSRTNIRRKQVLWMLLLSLLVFSNTVVRAQNTGSTGADGPLDFANVAPGTTVLFDPSKFNPPLNPAGDNIFNFTTIHIPSGVTVRLSGRILHGPVFWLATGDVKIDEAIDLNGESGFGPTFNLASRQRAMPGAGGFAGGAGGKCNQDPNTPQPLALSGDGPGGGAAGLCQQNNNEFGNSGTFSGTSTLIPLVGGSGGGGWTNTGVPSQPLDSFQYGAGGGAGGGALLIASPTVITINGNIQASGGTTQEAGAGSGGAIRLIAPTINGSGFLSARGGFSCCHSGNTEAPNGLIRLDTFFDGFSHNFNGGPFQTGSTMAVFPPTIHPPSILVTAVNGTAVTQPPTGGPVPPDVSINSTAPVTVNIQASFIPVGTVLTLFISSDNNTEQAVQTTPLQGTFESSTATATVTFPSGFSLNYVKATWTQ